MYVITPSGKKHNKKILILFFSNNDTVYGENVLKILKCGVRGYFPLRSETKVGHRSSKNMSDSVGRGAMA